MGAARLCMKISMSLDGFVAGPHQSVKDPLGVGGERLHEWFVPLAIFREPNPPYHHPVFVLTHHARAPLVMEGGTTFTFVTDGIESALAQAKDAAGGKDVTLAGGAAACNQYLAAGLVDEMEINLAPVLLGRGERLFAGVDDLHGLALVRTVATPQVVHLKFARL